MKIKASSVLWELRRLLFLGLLLVSGAVILLPQYRIESTVVLQRSLLTAAGIWTMYQAWRHGYLFKTHDEVAKGIQNHELRRAMTAFEILSTGIGFIAALVLALS